MVAVLNRRRRFTGAEAPRCSGVGRLILIDNDDVSSDVSSTAARCLPCTVGM